MVGVVDASGGVCRSEWYEKNYPAYKFAPHRFLVMAILLRPRHSKLFVLQHWGRVCLESY